MATLNDVQTALTAIGASIAALETAVNDLATRGQIPDALVQSVVAMDTAVKTVTTQVQGL